MDIKISHSWLSKYLKTNATPKKIGECLSLCGPSVEKIEGSGRNAIYHIEITTNRIDTVGVYGIAKEAAAILPRFNIDAKLVPFKTKSSQKFCKKVNYLDAKVDHTLCSRFTAVLIKDIKIQESSKYIKEHLKAVGVRPINNVVDISNYVLHELGQPVHTFDYDKIKDAKMVLRKSKKGEKIITLDGKGHSLPGGDIVIEDGGKTLIDLAGIMGGKTSEVDEKTTNVLLFVQTYNPAAIRKTSMKLAHRTEAASIFEKGLDPELVTLGIKRGIDLFVELAGGIPETQILDLYPSPYKTKKIVTNHEYITKRLGIEIAKKEIIKSLNSLSLDGRWLGNKLEVKIPSFRANDISIPEDIIEEIARIYGYHNLPSILMAGDIPTNTSDTTLFSFENNLKNLLFGLEGIEVYTLSLVPKSFVDKNALRIKNPLGTDTAYLRTTLSKSLISSAKENSGMKEPFHLYEISNIYIKKKGSLPNEKMILAGIFSDYSYRLAKGIVETLLNRLNIDYETAGEEKIGYEPGKRIVFKNKTSVIGELGCLEKGGLIYYEFGGEILRKLSKQSSYKPIPKYPPQIEDITVSFPPKTRIGEVVSFVKEKHPNITSCELVDEYENSYTFRVWYQDPNKTLDNKEVEKIREKIAKALEVEFGGIIK